MAAREKIFVRNTQRKNPNWKHILWTDRNLPKLPNNMLTVYDIFGKTNQYAFQADLLRLWVVKEFGGIYLDVDFDAIDSFDKIAELPHLFCDLNGVILNGVFAANKNNEALEKACNEVGLPNTWYGPSWFSNIVKPYTENIIKLEEFEKTYAKHHALGSWLNK